MFPGESKSEGKAVNWTGIKMYINTKGLVLRETRYKESSKIMTVLTSEEGKLTVTAKGALRRNSRLAAVTQILAFSEMTLYSSRGRWTLTEAQSIEMFHGLRNDLDRLALGSYIAELAEALSDEDSPNLELLSLCLNTLYALSEGIREPEFIKPAFELKLMAISGFAPLVTHCAVCGKEEPDNTRLDLMGGILYCAGCTPVSAQEVKSLTKGTLDAIRFIINCGIKKLFFFTLGEQAQKNLRSVAEGYLLTHLDRRFRTLEYYNALL